MSTKLTRENSSPISCRVSNGVLADMGAYIDQQESKGNSCKIQTIINAGIVLYLMKNKFPVNKYLS